jgi:hypothetical protein
MAELPADGPIIQAVGLLSAVMLSIAALWAAAMLFGLVLKGCEFLGRNSEENKERALECNSANEDLDQIKRLRDNGFANERAVSAIEHRKNKACTW